MFRVLKTRLGQGHRTVKYPNEAPALPDRFKGLLKVDSSKCSSDCASCIGVCPVKAIQRVNDEIIFDMGKCIFCGACEQACSKGAVHFTSEFALAVRNRRHLYLNGKGPFQHAERLEKHRLCLFKRSIRLRQVSAGGCNACEADVNVLNTVVFDLSRFGVQFVASPRHADGLLITGPVTKNMESALIKTCEATPSPKIVIAAGACAVSGGMFSEHKEVCGGADKILPVDLYIPGCPPHPYTLLDGILRLLDKIKNPNSTTKNHLTNH